MSVSAPPKPPQASMLATVPAVATTTATTGSSAGLPLRQQQPRSMPSTPAAALYPTTTSGGWTVVHHGVLGPPEAYNPHAASSSTSASLAGGSGRRSASATRLPISNHATPSVWRPTATARDPRPLPVPPPLDTVSIGSTTFTRRPTRGHSSDAESSKGKRRASINDVPPIMPVASTSLAVSPSAGNAISPSSTTSSRPLPLPPPTTPASASSANAIAGPSRSPQKPKSTQPSRQQRARTPDAAGPYRSVNASQERIGYSTSAVTTRSPTIQPFEGVSGIWASPRPAADSHPRNRDVAESGTVNPRSSSRDQTRTRTTSSSSTGDRPVLSRKTSGGMGSGTMTNLRRKTSGDVVDSGLQPKISGGILRTTTAPLAPRKSSLGPGGVRSTGSSPAHSRNPSLTTPLVIPTYIPPPSHALPPVPPPPPLQHPIRKGTDPGGNIIPMGPLPKSFVAPPPPPPLPSPPTSASTGSTLSPKPPPPSPPNPPPPLKMSSAIMARHDAAAFSNSPSSYAPPPTGNASDTSTPSSARSAPSGYTWRFSDSGTDTTALTTPGTSRSDSNVYAGSPLASATVFGATTSPTDKRERRRLQLHSPVEIVAGSPVDRDPPMHSHPIGEESEERGPESATSERSNSRVLAALEGQVGDAEMDGVLLSPPTFASRVDDDDLDHLDLYDDDFDDVDDGADRGRRGRSPSPIRYARRASVDDDMIFSDSSEEEEPDHVTMDNASVDSPAPSFNNSDSKSVFNDARSTFSRARSTRSRRKWRNTRAAPPPVPLGSAAGMGMEMVPKRHQRSRSADSLDGEGMAPSAMWRMQQEASTKPQPKRPPLPPLPTEMRFVYQASDARLPASIPPPPMLMMANHGHAQHSGSGSAASLSAHESGSTSGHGGSSEYGHGHWYAPSPSTSKNSLPLPPKSGGFKLLPSRSRKDKGKSAFASTTSHHQQQHHDPNARAPRHSSSFSLLRIGGGTASSSVEALMNRASESSNNSVGSGSDERRVRGKTTLFGGR
uniref:Uncharacterized protein n=1 Tax=Mycena chlorophos TaxID=658473 RepID=A0ABQ0LCY7_MYCCL|nr:predicted protein [Mycena chlorophos]